MARPPSRLRTCSTSSVRRCYAMFRPFSKRRPASTQPAWRRPLWPRVVRESAPCAVKRKSARVCFILIFRRSTQAPTASQRALSPIQSGGIRQVKSRSACPSQIHVRREQCHPFHAVMSRDTRGVCIHKAGHHLRMAFACLALRMPLTRSSKGFIDIPTSSSVSTPAAS
jgi:hypothetical protein